MAVTPAAVSNVILSNIDELVILLDADLKIISMNEKTLEIIESRKNYHNRHISEIVKEFITISGEMQDLIQGKYHDFSCRLNFKSGNDHAVLMDGKFKSITDKYQDFVGILLVAKEVKEAKQLRDFYKITHRETGIIQSIIAGKTNQQISEELGITESTVKSHIVHIFNKLAIDNRVQLIILLKDYKLIPEKQADKLLFLKQKGAKSTLD